ncbi:glycosyltransferase [Cesiribacter sp. SM1]|uniref:CgeB family protein n=1 Tax=Cesiribacter sp. SM1 TaxID=2861196 RepID=UPI001CD4DAA4|nr:glycosyltransferase [Cesiribacter sp. SM1]
MKIAFFGSSLVSAYWNGAATYYRGIISALYERGHQVTFYEPDAYQRQQNRDIDDPEYATVRVYEPTEEAAAEMLKEAATADLIVKASGVGVLDEYLEAAVLRNRKEGQLVAFWDVDAPATLHSVHSNPQNPFKALIPQYDYIFTYGGGEPVIEKYTALGAIACIPIYNALDPATHHPVPENGAFSCDLAFLGNRLPDREQRVEEFFLKAASLMPDKKFILGGSGWADKPMTPNVNYIGHVSTNAHNAFNCTPLAVLNISRESMASNGFSPATRVFEAAGAGACLITDYWEGIELFLEPGTEVLVARNGVEVADILQDLTPEKAKAIGAAALKRVLSEHTYRHRAKQFEEILEKHLKVEA